MFVYVYKLYFCIIHDQMRLFVVSTSNDCNYLDKLELDSIKVMSSDTLLQIFSVKPLLKTISYVYCKICKCLAHSTKKNFSKLAAVLHFLQPLKGPSQPHLCFCLHARIQLLYFIWSMSKRRKNTVKLVKIIEHTLQEHRLQ